MNKKLPSVFVNMKDKVENNNQKLFYSKNKESFRNISTPNGLSKVNLSKKINEIFSSTKFVYKLPVEIITKADTIYTEIVAKNKKMLITKDNKSVDIDDIIDINER